MLNIKKGENALIHKFLKKKDKSNFDRTEFDTLTVELLQAGNVITTYEFDSDYLRAGTDDNEIELEISTAISSLFSGGKVIARYTFSVPDVDLFDSAFTVILTEEILNVENVP
jgi:hypothetical protein